MNRNPEFLARKRRRVYDPHVRPLNAMVDRWNGDRLQVPYADPDSGGIHARILFLHESPDPRASAEHRSGLVKIFAPNPESSGIDSSGTLNLLIRTVYTCADGSGTFNALKHVFITFTENGFTNTGPIQLLGGTGSHTGLGGHGVNNGTRTGDTGVGQISGVVVSGT